jgi:hypothetical protein
VIKPPFLVSIDPRAGLARRYVRRKDYAVAGLGWQLDRTYTATFDPATPLDVAEVERFRLTGVV